MGINLRVRVGVEWINNFPPDSDQGCDQIDLSYSSNISRGFYDTMGAHGHTRVFDWGDNNAWSSDLEHPDFGGDSLNWSDNVHFFYYSDHGANVNNVSLVAFAVSHPNCLSWSTSWRLGVKSLKWLAVDACQLVLNTTADHIVAVWGRPMQGIHLVFGSIGDGSPDPGEGRAFAEAICDGTPLANAWLDTTYFSGRKKFPIAIAAGETEGDAINRRENETLNWRDINVRSTNWLAWKYRSA